MPTLKHRDLLRGSIRFVLAITAVVLSFVSIKKESRRLATSSPLSKRHDGKEPPRVKTFLPLARAMLQKTPTVSTDLTSSFNTLTYVFQATSVPVE